MTSQKLVSNDVIEMMTLKRHWSHHQLEIRHRMRTANKDLRDKINMVSEDAFTPKISSDVGSSRTYWAPCVAENDFVMYMYIFRMQSTIATNPYVWLHVTNLWFFFDAWI